MDKEKRASSEIRLRERILLAKAFDHTIFAMPREFTRHMTGIVRYPKLINDLGRTVDVRRAWDNRFSFEIRQKRYLGRGTYAISARATGFIDYDEKEHKTRITGIVKLGGQYVTLLNVMTAFVLLSFGLIFVAILYLPLFLLMSAVIGLHWMYLFADRHDLEQQLALLVDLTERELRLKERDHSGDILAEDIVARELASKQ